MSSPTPLKFLMPGWFSLVMGLCGLALAWHSAQAVLGDMASGLALVLGVLAVLVFGVLLVASVLRMARYPQALADDLKHPVRHAFVAALPVSLLLLATVGVALGGATGGLATVWRTLWWLGSLTQLWATLWVLSRWIAPAAASLPGQGPSNTGLWPAVTPVLLIPVVGNVVAPLAGIPLGMDGWSAAQMGIGVFFWPLVLLLTLVRRIAHSPLPERVLPAWFITIAPPAVVGLVLVQMQAPLPAVQALWGVGLFFLLWTAPVVKRIVVQPFGVPFWALSFPLAAFTTLTLRLAPLQLESRWHGLLQNAGLLLLASTSMVVLWLAFATVRGLRDGTLLAPEPVANIIPVSA
ncbi:MAG: C4-dicarboxylate ABC transporter [Hydrogenophaga sp.]|uniref:SLAC1 family transporter n=1 Tax=Hydrogenophaga sp. TaxID=1904254 RepID=UPI002731A597|nr:C4-dicarboxylate ABC transporter [Hydrogenophaga sp.]MDP2165991.1 C4-dicarboxylate ABC transporter [Hydrogenophaga sp.]MDP3477605.1 C4-dicarboxylate ABC transporter [Hydrogenophaga sp.]